MSQKATPISRNVGFTVMHDERTGLVLIPMGGGRVTIAGNAITGEVFYGRVHYPNEEGNLSLPVTQLPVAWQIPSFEKEIDKVATIARNFLFNNAKLATSHPPGPDITPAKVLEASTLAWLPRIAAADRSLADVTVAALESLVRVHTGQISPSETIVTFEMLISMLLAMPDDILNMKLDPADVQRLADEHAQNALGDLTPGQVAALNAAPSGETPQ